MIQSQLVSDMLDMSRMTVGQIVLDINLVDLPLLVESAVETMRPAAVEKGIELENVGTVAGPECGASQQSDGLQG